MTKKIINKYISDPVEISRSGYGLLNKFAKSMFIVLLVLGVIGFIGNANDFINTIQNISNNTNPFSANTPTTEEEIGSPAAFVLITTMVIVSISLLIILLVALVGGTIAASANSAANQKNITIKQSIKIMWAKFNVLYMVAFLSGIRIVGGYLLFIIPGIRAQLRYSAIFNLVLAEDVTAEQAIKRSKVLYTGHLTEMLSINFMGLIPIIGEAILSSAVALSYKQLANFNALKKETGKMHPNNKIVNIVGTLIVVLMTSIWLISLL